MACSGMHRHFRDAFFAGAMAALLIVGVASAAIDDDPMIGTTGGPDVPFRGCIYYEHINFTGASVEIREGTNRRYVGDKWNDKISSAACHTYCDMTIYEHRDFGGAKETIGGYIENIGGYWNDRISSMKVACETPPAPRREKIELGMEDNTNRVGSDYHRIELSGRTPEVCQRACKNDPKTCRSWTYVRPGVQGSKAVCYLKNRIPERIADKCCISGVERKVVLGEPLGKSDPPPSKSRGITLLNSQTNPIAPPRAGPEAGILVGNGWNFADYWAADIAGDRKAELLVRSAGGDVLIYPFDGKRFYDPSVKIYPFETKSAGPTEPMYFHYYSWKNFTHYWLAEWGPTARGFKPAADMLVRTVVGDVYLYVFQPYDVNSGKAYKVAEGWNYADYFDGDFNGDGTYEMVGRASNGDLQLLIHWDGSGVVPKTVGRGFNYANYIVGDFTGDGRDDVIGRTVDGDMILHEFDATAFTPGVKIGNGWDFTHYWAGDWSGDGADDLIVRTETGDLLLYAIANKTFYGAPEPTIVALSWNFANYFTADFSGDGKIDFIARAKNGDLYYFPWKATQF